MHDTIEFTAAIDASLDRINIVTPTDFVMPPGGLNIRLGDPILTQEARLHDFKRDDAGVRARTRSTVPSHRAAAIPRLASSRRARVISTSARHSTNSASTRSNATNWASALYKVGCSWPLGKLLRTAGVLSRPRSDHRGRGEALAARGAGARGALRHRQPAAVSIGKKYEQGNWLFPWLRVVRSNEVAICIWREFVQRV